jgi:hypothetical protein
MLDRSHQFADFGVDADAGVVCLQAASPLKTPSSNAFFFSAGGLP